MQSVLIMQCFTCIVSLFFSALYAKSPFYLVLYMESGARPWMQAAIVPPPAIKNYASPGGHGPYAGGPRSRIDDASIPRLLCACLGSVRRKHYYVYLLRFIAHGHDVKNSCI